MNIRIIRGEVITDANYLPLPEATGVLEKQQQREAISADVDRFIAGGGKIEQLSPQASNWRDWRSGDFKISKRDE